MRTGSRPAILISVTIRIVIELDGHEDPIEGRLIEPEPQASEFRGWLALTTLIENIRLDAAQPPPHRAWPHDRVATSRTMPPHT